MDTRKILEQAKQVVTALSQCSYLASEYSDSKDVRDRWVQKALSILDPVSRLEAVDNVLNVEMWDDMKDGEPASTVCFNVTEQLYRQDREMVNRKFLIDSISGKDFYNMRPEDIDNLEVPIVDLDDSDFTMSRPCRKHNLPCEGVVHINRHKHSGYVKLLKGTNEDVIFSNTGRSQMGKQSRMVSLCVMDKPEYVGEEFVTLWGILRDVIKRTSYKCVEYVCEKWPKLINTDFLDSVASCGSLTMLKQLHDWSPKLFTHSTMREAVCSNRADVVELLIDLKCPMDGAMAAATGIGNVYIMDMLHKAGNETTYVSMNNAAGRGHVGVLKKLVAQGFHPNSFTMECACDCNRVDAFEYLHSSGGGVIEPCMLESSCKGGNLAVLLYCLFNGSKDVVTDKVIMTACKTKIPHMLIALHIVAGVQFRDIHFECASMYGNVPHLVYMQLVTKTFPRQKCWDEANLGANLCILNPCPGFGSQREKKFMQARVSLIRVLNCAKWLASDGCVMFPWRCAVGNVDPSLSSIETQVTASDSKDCQVD